MPASDTQRIESQSAATRAWDQLAEQVDALIAAWEAGNGPPELAKFVPADLGKHRPMILAELIKVDLEFRWHQKRGQKKLEDYAAEFPDLAADGQLPGDLIYEEYHIRKQAGDPVKAEEYYARFPQQSAQLKRLLGLEERDMTTTLCGGKKKNTLSAGQKIDDFDLLTALGEGAFATVFLARQISMQRIVALKVSADKGTESQTLAQLDHPNIVRVYDQRVIKDKKLRLMYMQHIPGGTLQAVVERVRKTPAGERSGKLLLAAVDAALEKQGDSPPLESSLRRKLERYSWGETVCWLGARLATGLDYAHHQGVLHRDVKPANVLLSAEGSPKLVDFNVSFSSKVSGASPAAYFGGSVAYMSPEQLEAADVDNDREPDSLDGRSDAYSLGIILWELLVGERPFQDSVVEGNWSATLKQLTARRRAGIPPEAIAKLPKDLPPGLVPTLHNSLHPDADQRPATAGMLAKQLDVCLQPQVQRLLLPSSGGFVDFLKRYPLAVMIFLGLAANGVLSYFNTAHNYAQIIQRLLPKDPGIAHFFWDHQVPVVNCVCYTIGLTAGIWMMMPVYRALGHLRDKEKVPANRLSDFRHKSVLLGERITWVTIGLWIMSGIAFSLWLRIHVGESGALDWQHVAHFMASQVVCGLIACTQTFFPCTAFSLRFLYPRFVRPEGAAQEADFQSLSRLERLSGRFFVVAVVAPFIAVFLLLLIPEGSENVLIPDGSENVGIVAQSWAAQFFNFWSPRGILLALTTLGGLGAFLSFWLYRIIQADIAALVTALDPARGGGVDTDSFDTSWTRTR